MLRQLVMEQISHFLRDKLRDASLSAPGLQLNTYIKLTFADYIIRNGSFNQAAELMSILREELGDDQRKI
jgi:hypothetical protein